MVWVQEDIYGPGFPCIAGGITMLEAIRRRRSIRKYRNEEVPEEDLKKILEAAMYAPSAWGTKPWHFVVVKDPELKEKLSKATPYAAHNAGAPAVIVLVADMNLAKRWIEDLSIAAAHIMLQAADLGYGTCFIQIRDSENEGRDAEEYVKKFLGIPEGYNVECMITVGKPAEQKAPHEEGEYMEERVHLDRW